jgi:hypothetical protein
LRVTMVYEASKSRAQKRGASLCFRLGPGGAGGYRPNDLYALARVERSRILLAGNDGLRGKQKSAGPVDSGIPLVSSGGTAARGYRPNDLYALARVGGGGCRWQVTMVEPSTWQIELLG